jgi:hypothetical protein
VKRRKTAITPNLRSGIALIFALSLLSLNQAFPGHKKPARYALIFGTVYDANQRALPGVKVKIARAQGMETGKTWEHVSDRRGEFAQRVPAGKADYLVWAETKPAKGKTKGQRPEVRVHVENDERQDIGLHLTE